MLCQLLNVVVSGNQQKEMKMKTQEGLRSLKKMDYVDVKNEKQ